MWCNESFTVSRAESTAWEIRGHIDSCGSGHQLFSATTGAAIIEISEDIPMPIQEPSADLIREQQVAVTNKPHSDIFFPSNFTD